MGTITMGDRLRFSVPDGNLAGGEDFDRMIVAANFDEEKNRQGNEKQSDPRALREFRNQNHDHGDACDESAETVHHGTLQPNADRDALRQCLTIPNCESVKARNAPTAYSGMSRSVTPQKTIKRKPLATARTTMP